MFRSILVPLDGTTFAETALPVASRLARVGSGTVHMVLSHQIAPMLAGVPELPPPLDLDLALRSEEHDYLMTAAANLVLAGQHSVAYHEVEGPPGAAIIEEAARVAPDLVVMATHGRGVVGRLIHGSVADQVIRQLGVPVLLVHSDAAARRWANGTPRGILVALDLSANSEAILEPVERLALLTGASVSLMHMIQEPPLQPGLLGDLPGDGPPPVPLSVLSEARQRLEAVAAGLRERGLSVTTRVATGFNPAWVLRDVMAESQFDLLAMTTHGRGGLQRLWLGSVASQLVQSVTKPILLLRSHADGKG